LTLALQKNYIKPSELKIIHFTSGWEVQEAIAAGKIDLAIMPFTYAWTSVAKGYKLKIVSCLERETDGILTSASIQDIKELQNKKIGLLRASTLEILMQDTAGLNSIEYESVYFRTPTEMIAALKAEEVDAIVCYVPLIQKIGADYHVLHWFSETYPGHPCCDLVATEQILKSAQGKINNLLDGMSKATSDIVNPAEEVFVLMANLYGLDRQQSVEALKYTRFEIALTEADKLFERQMMEEFIANAYLKKLPATDDIYAR